MKSPLLVKKSKDVHWKFVNGEAVLMHFKSGDYYALDPVGTFLWQEVCVASKTMEQLIEALTSAYDCKKEDAIKDTQDFCGRLKAENLIEIEIVEISSVGRVS